MRTYLPAIRNQSTLNAMQPYVPVPQNQTGIAAVRSFRFQPQTQQPPIHPALLSFLSSLVPPHL